MRFPALIFLVSSVLFVSGCVCCPLLNRGGGDTSTGLTEDTVADTVADTAGSGGSTISGSMSELMNMGKSMKCVYESQSGGKTINVILYVSGEKFRMDTTTEGSRGSASENFHTISDGEWMFVWSSVQSTGSKFRLEAAEGGQAGYSGGGASFDLNKKTDYVCHPWVASDGMFSPPPGVKFMDMTQYMQGGSGQSTGGGSGSSEAEMKAKMCAVCDTAGNANAKAQCRRQLDC